MAFRITKPTSFPLVSGAALLTATVCLNSPTFAQGGGPRTLGGDLVPPTAGYPAIGIPPTGMPPSGAPRGFPTPTQAPVATVLPPVDAPALPLPVLTGIDVLQGHGFDVLQGKRVGLVTNQTGINREGHATIDILRAAPGVRLVALFGPEHGVRGQVWAGAKVKNSRDAKSGLPVYSLYGATRTPTRAMLKGIQTLVFDMQDIGSRSYTFIATLENCRRVCARYGIGLVVLDRPNPVGGAIEGNIPSQFSFVCPFPIPYRYGLTMGELARWLNARAAKKCSLSIVAMENYRHETFEATGLPWIRTSPNIPRPSSPFFYQSTGLLGEFPALSIGIGTRWPFELVGAPGLNATALAANLNARRLPGWTFRAVSWVPRQGAHIGKQCQGVQIILLDPRRAQTTRLNFEIYSAVRQVAPRLKLFTRKDRNAMFDKVCGTSQIRRLMMQGQSAASLWRVWNQGNAAFRRQSKPYLLYPTNG